MRSPLLLAVAAFLSPHAHATPLTGFVDGFDNNGAAGWLCASDPTLDAAVAVYAGPLVVGIYPRNVARPDAAPYCPPGETAGFSIAFDAASQAMFTGQTRLSLHAVALGLAAMLLPSSNPRTLNPLPLPSGRLLGLRPAAQVAGTVAAKGGAPRVSLFAGGPVNEGAGMESGTAQPRPGGAYSVRLPVPGLPATLAPGALLPVFGSSTSTAGVTVALRAPLALQISNGTPQAGTPVPIEWTVAQAGAVSGITNTTLTTWLPPHMGFAGLSGSIAFNGNDPSFSEALVEVGTTGDSQASCLLRNVRAPVAAPVMSRLWAGILKTNDTATTGIPVDFALGHVVPGTPGGTCLMTWISAGYPFLSATKARYARTRLSLQASAVAAPPGAAPVLPFGVGGEFRLSAGLPSPAGVYAGIMAVRPMAVDGIAGTASAAPVVGAPANSAWQIPAGGWSVDNVFMFLPAAICRAANLHMQPANGPLAVLRDATPATLSIPAGATPVLDMPMSSRGKQAIQRSVYASFPAGFSGTLQPGDCLVAYMTANVGERGTIDVENQSTVYLRLSQ